MGAEAIRDFNPQASFPLGEQDRPDRESASTVGRLADFVYHDLRHPLTAILAYAELLGGSSLSELQREDFY